MIRDADDRLERLISRYLDDECSSAEARELRVRIRREPQAEALFEEYSALDREVGSALRVAMGRSLGRINHRTAWQRARGVVGVAAAACIASILWLGGPSQRPAPTGDRAPQAASLFATPPMWGDSYRDPADSLPLARQAGDVRREWIVVPGERPGEYLLIEVHRPAALVERTGRDF